MNAKYGMNATMFMNADASGYAPAACFAPYAAFLGGTAVAAVPFFNVLISRITGDIMKR